MASLHLKLTINAGIRQIDWINTVIQPQGSQQGWAMPKTGLQETMDDKTAACFLINQSHRQERYYVDHSSGDYRMIGSSRQGKGPLLVCDTYSSIIPTMHHAAKGIAK
jgi:hypothetical protein